MKHILFVFSEGEFAEKVASFSLDELRAYRDAARREKEEASDPDAQLFYNALVCDLSAAIIERMAREGDDLLRKLVRPELF